MPTRLEGRGTYRQSGLKGDYQSRVEGDLFLTKEQERGTYCLPSWRGGGHIDY